VVVVSDGVVVLVSDGGVVDVVSDGVDGLVVELSVEVEDDEDELDDEPLPKLLNSSRDR
jgi:hypothetical protein